MKIYIVYRENTDCDGSNHDEVMGIFSTEEKAKDYANLLIDYSGGDGTLCIWNPPTVSAWELDESFEDYDFEYLNERKRREKQV